MKEWFEYFGICSPLDGRYKDMQSFSVNIPKPKLTFEEVDSLLLQNKKILEEQNKMSNTVEPCELCKQEFEISKGFCVATVHECDYKRSLRGETHTVVPLTSMPSEFTPVCWPIRASGEEIQPYNIPTDWNKIQKNIEQNKNPLYESLEEIKKSIELLITKIEQLK